MVVFRVILTLVCSWRACYMWLTRNHMFIREMWGKFTSFIFWDFEISPVSLGRFQNFQKVNSVNLSQISLLNITSTNTFNQNEKRLINVLYLNCRHIWSFLLNLCLQPNSMSCRFFEYNLKKQQIYNNSEKQRKEIEIIKLTS